MLAGDWISIDGDQRVGRVAASNFLGQLTLQFDHWFVDRGFDQIPVGRLRMAFVFGSQAASSFTHLGDFGLQLRIADHRFHVAQTFVPLTEVGTCERSTLSAGAATYSSLFAFAFGVPE